MTCQRTPLFDSSPCHLVWSCCLSQGVTGIINYVRRSTKMRIRWLVLWKLCTSFIQVSWILPVHHDRQKGGERRGTSHRCVSCRTISCFPSWMIVFPLKLVDKVQNVRRHVPFCHHHLHCLHHGHWDRDCQWRTTDKDVAYSWQQGLWFVWSFKLGGDPTHSRRCKRSCAYNR